MTGPHEGTGRGYFACPHCHKKYAATEKARAAEGRRIRCKGCGQPFVLEIRTLPAAPAGGSPPPQPPASRPGAGQERRWEGEGPAAAAAPSDPSAAGGGRRSPFGPRLRLMPLVVLFAGFGALVGWWLQQQGLVDWPVLLGLRAPVPANGTGVDRASANGAAGAGTDGYAAAQNDVALPDAAEVAEQTREVAPPDPAGLDFVVTPACREAAAAQWVNDYTLTHTLFKQQEFVRLIDESITLTDQVRKQCRNDRLLRAVIASAKQGRKPAWLAASIDALLNPEYDPDKVVGDLGY